LTPVHYPRRADSIDLYPFRIPNPFVLSQMHGTVKDLNVSPALQNLQRLGESPFQLPVSWSAAILPAV
jgi:hypothetical protein